jgi:ABC-type bacteriocin/lantibiotic exporter with double-glycine peptidase domain
MNASVPVPPGAAVRRNRHRGSLLFALFNRERGTGQILLIAVAAASVCWYYVAMLLRDMIDRVVVNQAQPASPFVTRIWIWAALLSISSAASIYLVRRIGAQVEFDLQVWLYTRLGSAVPARVDQSEASALVPQTAGDIAAVERLLDTAPAVAVLVPALLGALFGIVRVSPLLLLVALSPLAVDVWLLHAMRDRIRERAEATWAARSDVGAALTDLIRGIHGHGAQDGVQRFGGDVRTAGVELGDATRRRGSLAAVADTATIVVAFAGQVVVLLLGAHLVGGGRLWPVTAPFSLGRLFLAAMASVIVVLLVPFITELYWVWPVARQAQDRLSRTLALGSAPLSGGEKLPAPASGLGIRQATVDVGATRSALPFDLSVAPGETAVIVTCHDRLIDGVGRVAAGMTPPSSGEVTLEGVGIERLDPGAKQSAMRLLTSDPIATGGSLRENLTLGSLGAGNDEAFDRAIDLVGLSDLAGELGSLDAPLGHERSVAAPVRQRLGLARAILDSPRVLVMANALSVLEPDEADRLLVRVRAELPACAMVLVTANHQGNPPLEGTRTITVAEAPPSPASLAEAGKAPGSGRPDPLPGESSAPRRSSPARRLVLMAATAVALGCVAPLTAMVALGPIAHEARSGSQRAAHWVLVFCGVGALLFASRYAANITAARLGQKLGLDLGDRLVTKSAAWIPRLGRDAPLGAVSAQLGREVDNLQGSSGVVGLLGGLYVILMLAATVTVVALAPWTLPAISVVVVVIFVVWLTGWSLARPVRAWSERQLRSTQRQFDRDLRISGEIDAAYARQPYTDAFVNTCWERRRARNWVAIIESVRWSLIGFAATITPALLLARAETRELTGRSQLSTSLSVGIVAVGGVLSLALVHAYCPRLSESARTWRGLRSIPEALPDLAESSASSSASGHVEHESLPVTPASGSPQSFKGGPNARDPGS